ncbi:pol protein [Anopheles sinensis]|uniref:Pol protein n=1 Tax=Anopheles sinensis TaxID=74873 RepID=A0A084WTD7_ANOSI|nr:pol protein [Anopheles sinensis]
MADLLRKKTALHYKTTDSHHKKTYSYSSLIGTLLTHYWMRTELRFHWKQCVTCRKSGVEYEPHAAPTATCRSVVVFHCQLLRA